MFYDIIERKNACLRYKKMEFKKSKNCRFSKGLVHGFGQKLAIFLCFVLKQYRPGKCVLRYYRTKKRLFKPLKQEVEKVEKFLFFPKGLVHGFGQELAIFPCFVLRQYRPGKCVLRYYRTKRCLFRPLKQEVEKVEKLLFFQRG